MSLPGRHRQVPRPPGPQAARRATATERMNAAEIEAVIPHRPPFRFVDEIVELEPGVRAVGRLPDHGRGVVPAGPLPGQPDRAGRDHGRGLRPGGRRLRAHASRPPGQVRRLRGHRRDAVHPHRAARRRARHDDRDGAPADAARPVQRRPSRSAASRRSRRRSRSACSRSRPRDRRAALDRGHRLDRRGRPGADRHQRRDLGPHRHQRRVDPRAHRHRRAPDRGPDVWALRPRPRRRAAGARPLRRWRPPTSTSWSPRRARRTPTSRPSRPHRRRLGAHSGRGRRSPRPARAGSTRSCTPSRQIQSGLAAARARGGRRDALEGRRLGRPRDLHPVRRRRRRLRDLGRRAARDGVRRSSSAPTARAATT